MKITNEGMAESAFWNTANVKSELPDVPVRNGDVIVTGQIMGRQLPFALVHVPNVGRYGATVEVAWHTIVHTLNTNGAIRI